MFVFIFLHSAFNNDKESRKRGMETKRESNPTSKPVFPFKTCVIAPLQRGLCGATSASQEPKMNNVKIWCRKSCQTQVSKQISANSAHLWASIWVAKNDHGVRQCLLIKGRITSWRRWDRNVNHYEPRLRRNARNGESAKKVEGKRNIRKCARGR